MEGRADKKWVSFKEVLDTELAPQADCYLTFGRSIVFWKKYIISFREGQRLWRTLVFVNDRKCFPYRPRFEFHLISCHGWFGRLSLLLDSSMKEMGIDAVRLIACCFKRSGLGANTHLPVVLSQGWRLLVVQSWVQCYYSRLFLEQIPTICAISEIRMRVDVGAGTSPSQQNERPRMGLFRKNSQPIRSKL